MARQLTEVVRARLEPDLKARAEAILTANGLTVSEAIRLMLVKVVETKSIPFQVSLASSGDHAPSP